MTLKRTRQSVVNTHSRAFIPCQTQQENRDDLLGTLSPTNGFKVCAHVTMASKRCKSAATSINNCEKFKVQGSKQRKEPFLTFHCTILCHSAHKQHHPHLCGHQIPEEIKNKRIREQMKQSLHVTHKRSDRLTTKPNPFFRLISRMRPYPLKNFSTSLSLACGLRWPMKTRQPLIVNWPEWKAEDLVSINPGVKQRDAIGSWEVRGPVKPSKQDNNK